MCNVCVSNQRLMWWAQRQIIEPAKYVAGDKTKIEDLITNQLSNPLFSTGYGISVRDISDGSIVFESNAQNSMLPASLTKLYSAASTAITLDPDARFMTKVKYLDNNVYLVGGADPQLGTESNPTQADLADLAKETAQKLKEFNVFEVNVFVDDSILGPLQRPTDWEENYFQRSEIHLISALNLDDPKSPGQAPVDPSSSTSFNINSVAALVEGSFSETKEATRAIISASWLFEIIKVSSIICDTDFEYCVYKSNAPSGAVFLKTKPFTLMLFLIK